MTTPLYDDISHPPPHILDALTALAPDTQWYVYGTVENATDFANNVYKITGADSNNSAILSRDPADVVLTYSNVNAKLTELTNAHPMKLLRIERDRLLAETDWWASSDLTMTSAQTAYRQALRDITSSATSLDDVTWPTKPE